MLASSNICVTATFLFLYLPYGGMVWYNICIYIFERLKHMNPKRKAIICDMDKPEEKELWEFLQKLPHGRFSENTKSYWLGIMGKVKESKKMNTLAEALPKEIERVQELIKDYESVPMGHIAAGLMKQDIKKAHEAMISGDVVGMAKAHIALKDYE